MQSKIRGGTRISNSPGSPQLSVLIPWCDRREIRTTLAKNAPLLHRFDSEILVLNCGGDTEQLKMLLFDSKLPSVPEIRITDLPRRQFNKSYALNIGAYLSRSSRIFVLDADILLNAEIVRDALENLNYSAFVTVEKVFESRPINNVFGVRSRPGPGLVFIRKEHLIEVEGYNADLQYWGWEDMDLQIRLKRVLALEHCEVGSVFHLSHGDASRALFGKSRQSTNKSNLVVCCKRYAQGNFRGTYSRDVESWREAQRLAEYIKRDPLRQLPLPIVFQSFDKRPFDKTVTVTLTTRESDWQSPLPRHAELALKLGGSTASWLRASFEASNV